MDLPCRFSTLRESVVATLVFFDLFDFPLDRQELHRYLLGFDASRQSLDDFLQQELQAESPLIGFQDGFYFLSGREKLVAIRKERSVIAEHFWRKVHRFLPWMVMIPFVRMIAVCNTLAFDNPTPESDIDLFIVVYPGRLFIARTFMTLWLSLWGVRRHGKKIAGRFCLSFYITEDALNLEHLQLDDDIYLAYWFLTLQPVYGEKIYHQLLEQNAWTQSFFIHSLQPQVQRFRAFGWLVQLAKIQEWMWRGRLGNWLEQKLYHWQLQRLQKAEHHLGSQSSIVVNPTMLKFHNIDRRTQFSDRFKKHFQELKANF